MSVYNQITSYGPKDSLASGDPNKVIHGTQIDAEFTAIHNATLDCASLSLANTYSGGNTFNSSIVLNGSPTGTLGSGAVFNSATGGAQGAGTINATGLFINGATVPTVSGTNTWTGTNIFQGVSLVDRPSTSAGFGIFELDDQTGARKFQAVFCGSTSTGAYGATAGNVVLDTSPGVSFTLSTADLARMLISTSGNVTINAPTSGTTLVLNAVTNALALQVTNGTVNSGVYIATSSAQFGTVSAHELDFFTGNSTRLTVSSTGNVTINAPSSGTTLDITAVASSAAISVHGATGQDAVQIRASTSVSQAFGMYLSGGTNIADYALNIVNAAGTTNYFRVRGDGLVQAIDDGGTLQVVGWRGTPINVTSTSISATTTHRGQTVRFTASGTYTFNSGVLTTSDVVTIIADNGATVTISPGASMFLVWANGGSSSGSRTLTGVGMATLVMVNSTTAYISGGGLS